MPYDVYHKTLDALSDNLRKTSLAACNLQSSLQLNATLLTARSSCYRVSYLLDSDLNMTRRFAYLIQC